MREKKLWVDDRLAAPEGWVWAKGYKSAMRILEAEDYDFEIISLDHDLGGKKSGYDILCKIEQRFNVYQNYTPFIGIHTANPVGMEKMQKVADKINARKTKGKR